MEKSKPLRLEELPRMDKRQTEAQSQLLIKTSERQKWVFKSMGYKMVRYKFKETEALWTKHQTNHDTAQTALLNQKHSVRNLVSRG